MKRCKIGVFRPLTATPPLLSHATWLPATWWKKGWSWLLAWLLFVLLAAGWYGWPRTGVVASPGEVVERLSLSPKLATLPARGPIRWTTTDPLLRSHRIVAECDTFADYYAWRYGTEKDRVAGMWGFDSLDACLAWFAKASPYCDELREKGRLYHFRVRQREEGGCEVTIETVPIRH